MAPADWTISAAALADTLAAKGVLSDAWRSAFTAVPRHIFLPGNAWQDVYSDQAILTQTRPVSDDMNASISLPTSSSSAPSVMAVMLDCLNVTSECRVLEIGTGTGYNAALLGSKIGAKRVTSIDIDPELVATARNRLAELNMRPFLIAGDGADGVPARAPFDRILATAAVTHIPPTWINQLAPGGRIVAPLDGDEAALMVLDKTTDDEVSGRVDTYPAGFMPLRRSVDSPLGPSDSLGYAGVEMPSDGITHLDPSIINQAEPDLLLWFHLHIPGFRRTPSSGDTAAETATVHTPTARADVRLTPVETNTWQVTQRGSHRLWDTIEAAARAWLETERPTRTRLGITATTDANRQYIWLDDENGPYCWPLPL